jgi:hypothetical protein
MITERGNRLVREATYSVTFLTILFLGTSFINIAK